MTDFDRDAYFHRVQVTSLMMDTLSTEIKRQTGQDWDIRFSKSFWFRIVDRTDVKKIRDYGWYESMDDLLAKIKREFPALDLPAYKS